MQVILHTGAHATDEDRLLRGLTRNAEDWRADGVAVPGPSRYRTLLNDAVQALGRGAPAPEARDVLLETILTDDLQHVDRMVLSNRNFFCVPKLALRGGILYPWAEQRVGALKELFPGDEIELFIGLRDPATFLPAVFAETPQDDFEAFLDGVIPEEFRWSDLLRRLRGAHPDVPITTWANEDTPIIWGQILREMAGIELNRRIKGGFDLLSEIMAPEGMKRFREYLARHPDMTERQKRRVMVAFLDKYALDEAIEEELDVPGWTEERIEILSESYDADFAEIERMHGVTLIAP
ncbi:hypothetical protein ROJ8625_02125 [Roseivivax jejudonensis]|uniref:Uncharacterized protein n=1 Tax=Roseivivax jejudonensis TaxID=1529041 RepID=A0A1X6Z849_9RHOB|nr:hypothetical protein [Roseivivax jejudonensis]SLN43051.1 hypothetical protein ROJ8625_02125 [Roseivivax jejudonensis]